MKNRMSRCAALIGTVLSLSSYAQVCQEFSLYKDGEKGYMGTTRSFREGPEWSANWGDLDGMAPPYIRFSGMKDNAGDWTGNLVFEKMPISVQNGYLKMKVRTSQNARMGVWLLGDFGVSQVYFKNLTANGTTLLKVALKDLVGVGKVTVNKIGLGLFDVGAYQYTSLFVDDISLSCALSDQQGEAESLLEQKADFQYVYSDVSPLVSKREGKFSRVKGGATSSAYVEGERQSLRNLSTEMFVLSEQEHKQIQHFMKTDFVSADSSCKGWYRNMFYIERNRLRDSVIANPKTLFYEAESFAAGSSNMAMPLLVGNVDYAYRVCSDTLCSSWNIKQGRLLQVGLPAAKVYGSKLRLFYDPYFVSSNRPNLPNVEVLAKNKWVTLNPKSELELELDGAGLQKIQMRLTEGGVSVKQTILVEVR